MRDSELQTVVGGAAVVAGIGTLSFMLFPLALPALILLGLAALPVIPPPDRRGAHPGPGARAPQAAAPSRGRGSGARRRRAPEDGP